MAPTLAAPARRRWLQQFLAVGVAAGPGGWIAQAQAQATPPLPQAVRTDVPNAVFAGEARLRFFGLDVYDARLWVANGFRADAYALQPLALELRYLRSLRASAIAERSLKEMRRVGPVDAAQAARWLQAMQAAFVDVQAGDRMLGLHTPGMGARFWSNDQARPAIADPVFSQYFFGIWLDPNTSEPAMRTNLLRQVLP